jgi:hypothetical protein
MKKPRGLGLVYQPTYVDRATGEQRRASIWWIQYSVRGKRYRESSGSSNRVEAVKLLKRRFGEASEGRAIGHDIEKTTFENLCRILLDDYVANARQSVRRVKGALRNLGAFFADSGAVDITEDRLKSYIVYRQRQKAANATINRELAALKRAFHLAGRKVGQPPRFDMLRENKTRKGFFEPQQFNTVLAHLPEYMRPVLRSLTSRAGELPLNCSPGDGITSTLRRAGSDWNQEKVRPARAECFH